MCLFFSTIIFIFYSHFYVNIPAKDIYSVAEKVLNKINFLEGKNMFIIANMGLWFNSKTLMTNRITPALQWLNGLSEIPNFKNHIFWHETMSMKINYSFYHFFYLLYPITMTF